MTDPRPNADSAGAGGPTRGVDQERPAPGARLVAALLALLGFLVYNSNLRLVSSGDNLPARYLPFILLRDRTLALDSMRAAIAHGDPAPYWIERLTEGPHAVSHYPVTVPVVLTPLYLPAFAYLEWSGWSPERVERTARAMEKLSASIVASLSMAIMFLLLSRRVRPACAVLLTIAYGFGTNTWMISSQALWQHGTSELALACCLLLLTGPCTACRSFVAGFLCALAVACRPSDAVFALALSFYGCGWARGYRAQALAGLAIPACLLLSYNSVWMGSYAGGYGLLAGTGPLSDYFQGGMIGGMAGLLFSPTRGLFVFSPFLVFLPVLVAGRLRRGVVPRLDLLLLGATALQLMCFAKMDWRAGFSWGPRWLTDALPLLVWVLAPA